MILVLSTMHISQMVFKRKKSYKPKSGEREGGGGGPQGGDPPNKSLRISDHTTRNIGARTKVMGRRNFQESIIVSINKIEISRVSIV